LQHRKGGIDIDGDTGSENSLRLTTCQIMFFATQSGKGIKRADSIPGSTTSPDQALKRQTG
jgi:hypothetical protein